MKESSLSDEGRQCSTLHNEHKGSSGHTYSRVGTLSLLAKKKNWAIQISTAQRRYDGHSRRIIKVWAAGWAGGALLGHTWQRRVKRGWAWHPQWPTCSPILSGTRRHSRCPSFRRGTWPNWSLDQRDKPATRMPWWTLGRERGKRERGKRERELVHNRSYNKKRCFSLISPVQLIYSFFVIRSKQLYKFTLQNH